jgi:hypothetical protein
VPLPETKPVKRESAIPERKRKRLNLLIQPLLYGDLTKIAYVKNISVNEVISQAAKEYRERESRALEKHDVIMKMVNE